jgi:thiosulfate/3-mercaptopyruvate sulfurtransferase
MMPAADVFATLLGRLDYHPQVPLVLVDTGEGLRSAARVWWMFQSVGLENVWLLDGGLKAWEREGLPVTHTHSATPSLKEVLPATVQRIHGCMKPDRLHLYWCDKQAIDNRDVARTPVLDARMPERFLGTVPEPRAGLRSGHIEGSCNMPFHQVYDTATGKFLAPEKLHVLLSPYMKDATSLFTTCGSGVTACSLAVALRLLDTDVNAKIPPVMVYDGSWAEYGMQF